jgi:hypothetical protein
MCEKAHHLHRIKQRKRKQHVQHDTTTTTRQAITDTCIRSRYIPIPNEQQKAGKKQQREAQAKQEGEGSNETKANKQINKHMRVVKCSQHIVGFSYPTPTIPFPFLFSTILLLVLPLSPASIHRPPPWLRLRPALCLLLPSWCHWRSALLSHNRKQSPR